MDAERLSRCLSVLEERGLVRVSGDGRSRAVRFKHGLVRDASYDSILASRRASIHRRVAEAIRKLYPDRDLGLSLALANHWLNARDFGRLSEEVLPRSQQIISSGRSQALLELLDRFPIEQAPAKEALDLQIVRAEAYEARGQYARARELYEQVMRQADDAATCARLFYHMGLIHVRLSQPALAIDYQRQSLELAKELRDEVLQARAHRGLGMAYWNLSDYQNAEQSLARARELSARAGDSIGLADSEFNLSNVYRDRGEYPRAIESAQRALALYKDSGLTVMAAHVDLVLGGCYYSVGDLESAARAYQRATDMSRQLSDPLGEAVGLCNLAELHCDLKRFADAESDFSEAIRISRQLSNDYLLAFALTGLAEIQCGPERQAQPEELAKARANAGQALEAATRLDSKERIGAAHRVLAQVLAACGEKEHAIDHARQAVELLTQVGHALELKRAEDVYQALSGETEQNEQHGGPQ